MGFKKISISALAKAIGMSKSGLYTALDRNTLSVSALEKIADTLQVPASVFCGNEGNINYGNNINNSKVNQTITSDEIQCRQELQKAKDEISDLRAEIIDLLKKNRGK